MKRLVTLFCVVFLLVTLIPAVSAQEDTVLADRVTVAPPQVRLAGSSMPNVDLMEMEEALQAICQAMEARQPSVAVKIFSPESVDTNALFEVMLGSAMAHTGVPTQGDYLLWQYGGASGVVWYQPVSGGYEYTLEYDLKYYTTAQQEAQVTAAVEDLLEQLALDGLSDHQKLCRIYDYMCANITYDYAGLAAQDPLAYTAYGALIRGRSVCQGYANLLYRLCLEEGIDCRLISGVSNGGGHAWNIVKLGGKYYNMDATWDAGRTNYRYFLRGNAEFNDHTRDELYDTAQFHEVYPMSAGDYKPVSGDTNADGKVNVQDVEYLLMYTLYGEDFPLEAAADYTADGKTDVKDVEYLLMHTLYGEDFPLPEDAPAPEEDPSIEAPLPDGEEGKV